MQSSCPNHAPLPTRKLHAMLRGGNGRHGHDCDARREQNSIERRCRPLAGASCGSLLRADDMRFEIVEAVPVGCGWAVVGRPRDAQLHAVPDPSSASLRRRSMEWPPSPERLSYLLPRLNLPYEIEISLQNLAGTCAVYKPHRSDTRTHLRDSLARVRICLSVKSAKEPNVKSGCQRAGGRQVAAVQCSGAAGGAVILEGAVRVPVSRVELCVPQGAQRHE